MLLTILILAATTASTPIPLDQAQRIFEEIRLASDEEGGKLWGVPLAGPVLLVDRATRFAVGNVRDAEGALAPNGAVFTGSLPSSAILANTAMTWSGTRWAMVLWDSVSSRSVPRRNLLFHESWHRIQDKLGFPAADAPVNELDSIDGRYWLQLEFRALAAALKAGGDLRRSAVRDAITFRARRRKLFPAAGKREQALETNEGLAEYTGFALRGTGESESRMTLANRLTGVDRNRSFVRSFAYETGPAYGLLLDAAAPGWTTRFRPVDELAAVLAMALKLTISPDEADPAAARYDAAELRTFEEKRDKERVQKSALFRAQFVEGPLLELPMANARYGFDPSALLPLDGVGSVYPTLEVTADWGRLSAMNGAVISSDFSRILLSAPGRGGMTGDGWTLTLAPGWKIVPGARPGDYRVTRSK